MNEFAYFLNLSLLIKGWNIYCRSLFLSFIISQLRKICTELRCRYYASEFLPTCLSHNIQNYFIWIFFNKFVFFRMYRFYGYCCLLLDKSLRWGESAREISFYVVFRRHHYLSRTFIRLPYAALSFRVGWKTIQQVRIEHHLLWFDPRILFSKRFSSWVRTISQL